jgi:NAD(P)-dependent dehydrogenase (short-subunit alcohol dehydrogenase family)
MQTVLIVGGSRGIGRYIAERAIERGDDVIITSSKPETAPGVAAELGGGARGITLDLADPETIETSLSGIELLDHIIITAADPRRNSLEDFDVVHAARSTTIKLVGYSEVVRVLRPRLRPGGAIVLFGGLAMERPYPGSTMVTAANGGVSALARSMAVELAPTRVNVLHPGIVGDSPRWRDLPEHPHVSRTPIKRAVTMAEVADAAYFLLDNPGVNAIDLYVDGGIRVV